MIWFTLALFVISFIALALLSPKPELEDQRPNTLEDLNFPQAKDGMPVALILGTARFRAPNTLWFGDFKSVPIKEKIKTGIFTSKTIIKGYKYYVGFDLGLCVGPDVHLRRIWLDKDEVWSGDVGPSETALTIDKPNLFGGDEKGGGFVGTARFYGGVATPPVNAYVDALVTTYLAYNSVAHIVFEQPYIGNQTSLKAPSFELERFTDHLGLLAAERIITTTSPNSTPDGRDINPMEALYEILISQWGGLGLSSSDIDIASFKSAGETLAAEGNGISMILTRNSSGRKAIEEILRQVDGILYQDPEDGKIYAKLIRDDYVLIDTPIYNEQSVSRIKKFVRTSWDDTANQVRVTFQNRHNLDSPYADAVAMDQDMANINTQGKVNPKTISFPLCKEPPLAVDLATRERTQLGVPLYTVELELDRTAAALLPGDVFRLSWDEYNLTQVVFRVQKYDQGSLDQGKIGLSAIQDTFAIAQTVYGVPEETQHTPLDFDAVAVTDSVVWEAPYWLMNQQDDVLVPPAPSNGFVFTMARRPNGRQDGFSSRLTQDAFTTTVLGVDYYPYTNTALVDTAITATDGFVNGVTTITIKSPDPDSTILVTATAADIRATGKNLILINGELMAFEGVTDNLDGTWDLTNCHRALLDTTYEAHAVDDVVYFLDSLDYLAEDEFDATVSVTGRFMSFTAQDEYEFDDALNVVGSMNRRYERPLPPDYITVDGARSLSQSVTDASAPFDIAWRERNREDLSIRFENDATQTPETNQAYDVELYVGGILRDSATDVVGTTVQLDSNGNTGAAYILVKPKILGGVSGGLNDARYDFTVT